MAQTVNNPPAMQETWVRSLDQEDSLEKGMATHSRILAWENPTDRKVWQVTVYGSQNQTWLSDYRTHSFTYTNVYVITNYVL